MTTDCQFEGAEVVLADVTDPASVAKAFNRKIDIVISCNEVDQFILLSAICVRKPDLPLQLAKLKMEDELMRSGIDYTLIRPTTYFWVYDVQTKFIRKGRSGYLIGTGNQACQNPIAKEDLAEFILGCIGNSKHINRVHILGGPEVPDNIVTSKDSLLMIFEAMGKEPKLVSIPDWLIVAVIHTTRFIGLFWRKIGVFSEFLRTTRYYLINDMRAPGYGSITIKQHLLDTARKVQT